MPDTVLDQIPEQTKPQPMERKTLMGLFSSTDNWASVLGNDAANEIDGIVYGASDPETDRKRIANHTFLADAFKVSPDRIAEAPKQWQDAWATQVLGSDAAGMDDATFYGRVGQFLKDEQAQGDMLHEQSQQMARAFGAGEDFYDAFNRLSVEWSAKAPWDAGKQDVYREWHKQAWFRFEDFTNQHFDLLKTLTDYATATRSADRQSFIKGQRPNDLRNKAIAEMAALDPDTQRQLLFFAGAGVEGDEEKRGGISKTAFRVGRSAFESIKGIGRYAEDIAEMQRPASMFGPTQAQRENAAARMLDDLAAGVDPARGSNWFTEGFLAAAESLPHMLALAHPVGFAAETMAAGDMISGELEARGVETGKATMLAQIAAPAYAAIEKVQASMVLKGRVPGAERVLGPANGVGGLARNFLVRFTAGIGEQYGQEVAQDLIAPATQAVASALSEAIPGVEWGKEWENIKDAAPETLGALAWLTIIGAGVGTFKDRQQGKLMMERRNDLLAAGFKPETVERIVNAPTPEDAEATIQHNWDKRETGTPTQAAAVAALNAETASLPPNHTITKTDAGYVVQDGASNVVGVTASSEEAARVAKSDQAVTEAQTPAPTPSTPERDGTPVVPQQPQQAAEVAPQERAPLPSNENVIALNKEAIKAVREQMGMDALPAPERQRFGEVLEQAQRENIAANVESWAASVLKSKEYTPISAKDHAAVLLRAAELQNSYDALMAESAEALDAGYEQTAQQRLSQANEVHAKIDVLTEVADRVGTEAGRALSIRRMRIFRDTYTLAKVVQRATIAKKAALTEQEHAQLKELSDKLALNEAKIQKLEKALEEKNAAATQQQAGAFVAEGRARRHAARAKDAAARRATYKQELAKLGYRMNDVTNVVGLSAEVATLLAKIAETHIEEGAANLADVVAKIQAELPDFTAQDIYNSLGRRTQRAKKAIESEAKRRIKELRTQAKILAQINDAMTGKFDPAKPPRKDSDEVKALRKQLGQLRAQADKTASDDAQLKRLHEKINEVQAQLSGGWRLVPDEQAAERPDIAKAREQLAELRREMDLVDQVAQLEDEIRTGERKPAQLRSTTESARIEELKAKRDELRRQVQGERTNDDARKRLSERIADLEDQIERGYREIPTAKKRVAVPVDIAEARKRISELERLMRTQDAIADLEEQLRTGDFKVSAPEQRVIESAELEDALVLKKHLQRQVNQAIDAMTAKGVRERAREVAELSRSILATADWSSIFRQGLFLISRRPTAFAKAFGTSARSFISSRTADAVESAIERDPRHIGRLKAGLELSSLDVAPNGREEYFASSLAERIPGLKYVVKASNRHMTTFLNLMRVAAFDQVKEAYPDASPAQLKAWANWININSGKGDLGRAKAVARDLSFLMWSPRWFVSRFQVVYTPFKHIHDPIVRKEIAKDIGAVVGLGVTALALAAAAGLEVGDDPRSPDFGKIIIGRTRYDIWGGMQQTARIMALPFIALGDTLGLYELEKDIDFFDAGRRFLSYKLSPTFTLPFELATQTNVMGQSVTADETLVNSLVPMSLKAGVDSYQENDSAAQAALDTVLSSLGVGVQTYEDKGKPKKQERRTSGSNPSPFD